MAAFGPDGVKLFQLKLDEQFLEKAKDLERKVAEGRQYEVCKGKKDPIWRYLEACYTDDPMKSIRDLLGYNEETVSIFWEKYLKGILLANFISSCLVLICLVSANFAHNVTHVI